MENTRMKVIAIVGSARKKHTYDVTEKFLGKLQSLGNVECEIVRLSDYTLGTCRGCMLCMDKGEEWCPYKDDRDRLIEKMTSADGVIFASPNYAFHVSGMMKIYIDRIGFVLHRPRFFGKAFTGIVAQGIYGGGAIVKYLNFLGRALGFNVVGGCCINSLEPMTDKGRKKIDALLDRQSKRFFAVLVKKAYPKPSLFELMVFRMARTSRMAMLDENFRDYTYWKEKGWFEADYYYPVKLPLFKKFTGWFFDMLAIQIVKTR
jgi:multimeric flavodoxin WrbA